MTKINLLAITLLFLFSLNAFSQEKNILGPVGLDKELPSVEREVKVCLLHLMSQPEENREYLRYFTSYAVPKELQDDNWLALSFCLHSLIGVNEREEQGAAGGYYPLGFAVRDEVDEKKYTVKVFNQISPTIAYIDIRNFNFSPQSWENISQVDGYFVSPVVKDDILGFMRLLAGNVIVRSDWFIKNSMDVTLQADQGRKVSIYRELLYSRSKQPKTADEFEQIWGLSSKEKARQRSTEGITLTVNEVETVARHNRILVAYRTDFGNLWRSYDVLSETGKRDYVTNFIEMKGKPPEVFDAGEIIANNIIGLQIYELVDGQGKIINEAAAGAARHVSDVLGDVRVRVSFSCQDCHSQGSIPANNTIKEFINSKTGAIKLYDNADKLRIERAYLSEKFEDSIEDGQAIFARSLKRVNGLTPAENNKSYLKMVSWYSKSLDLPQVLVELGCTEAELLEKIGGKDLQMHYRRKIPERLSLLVVNKTPIRRETFEVARDNLPSVFQQCAILIKGVTLKTERTIIGQLEEKPVYVNVVESSANGLNLDAKWYKVEIGQQYKYLGQTSKNPSGQEFYNVQVNGKTGFILKTISKLEQ